MLTNLIAFGILMKPASLRCKNPPRIVAEKGAKQIGQVTLHERGVLVTMCCCANAVGQALTPAYIFPRVYFKPFMLHDAPNGSLGVAIC